MQPGSFIINGQYSTDLGCAIAHRPEIPAPVRKVRRLSVARRDGDILLDDEAYENVPFTLELSLKADTPEEAIARRDALFFAFTSGAYVPLTTYLDPDKTYDVLLVDMAFQGGRSLRNHQLVTLSLSAKPYKRLHVGLSYTLTGAGALLNPTRYQSKPFVTVQGTGDVALSVNGVPFTVENLNGHVRLDAEARQATQLVDGVLVNRNNDVLTREYPVFLPGSNTLSWTGAGVTSVVVEPRWRSLL